MSRETVFSARMPVFLGCAALAILVGGFGSWSALTRIAGAVIAPGQLEVASNRQVVQHPEGGVVEAVLVSEGERVSAGQVLLRLDPGPIASDLAIVEGQLFELMARRARLEAERDDLDDLHPDPLLSDLAARRPDLAELVAGQRRLLLARRATLAQQSDQLGERITQIHSQIDGIEAQYAAMRTQLGLVSRELETQQLLLDKGLSQVARVLSLQREEARLHGAIGDLEARRAETRGRITEYGLEQLKLTTTRREEAITALRDMGYREMELAERRRALGTQLAHLQISAPVDGVVYGLTVFAPHAVLRPAEPLLYLVPQDRPLVISVKVDPIHVDTLFVGQTVLLRFPTFDQRTTPELAGHLMRISPDAFQDPASGRRYYSAEIRIDEGELDRLPKGLTLIPGMPVEAHLRTADRTPLAYIVKPLSDYFSKAMREG